MPKKKMGRPRKFRHPAAFTIMAERALIGEARKAARITGTTLSDVTREALRRLIVKGTLARLTLPKKEKED
jgi:hypothetical protein